MVAFSRPPHRETTLKQFYDSMSDQWLSCGPARASVQNRGAPQHIGDNAKSGAWVRTLMGTIRENEATPHLPELPEQKQVRNQKNT
jgi:hypothetical protein